MSKELPRSCPFCDEDYAAVKVLDVPNDSGFPVAVVCSNCGAQGPIIRTSDMDENSATEKWNDRPTERRLTIMVLETERRYKK